MEIQLPPMLTAEYDQGEFDRTIHDFPAENHRVIVRFGGMAVARLTPSRTYETTYQAEYDEAQRQEIALETVLPVLRRLFQLGAADQRFLLSNHWTVDTKGTPR